MENKDIFKLKGSKKIIVVTNRHLVKEKFLNAIEKCVLYGADAVMLREKDLQYEELMEVGEQTKNITDNYGVPLIINGNFRASLELETYGFHTGFERFKSMNRSVKKQPVYWSFSTQFQRGRRSRKIRSRLCNGRQCI